MRMKLLYYNCTFALFIFCLHKLGIEAHAYAHYISLPCLEDRCYAYGRPNLTLTLTLTRPYANISWLLYFMAVVLNRSFCFSTVRESTLQTLGAMCQNTLRRLSQNDANFPTSYQNKKLSCRWETARRFVSLTILLSHSRRSFEMTLLRRACVSPY